MDEYEMTIQMRASEGCLLCSEQGGSNFKVCG